MITTELIKELRDKTGVSIMQCKKALEETNGDMDKALIVLHKKSGEIAAKKGDRDLGSGAVGMYLHASGTVGSMILLQSETDFVSKNEEFRTLARDIAMHVAATAPTYLKNADIPDDAKATAREVFAKEAEGKPADMIEKIIEGKMQAYFKEKVLLEQSFIKNPEVTIQGLIDQAVQKFGERVEVAQFVRFSA